MSEDSGDKSELPSEKRLLQAIENGQIPKSQEIQTVGVIFGGMWALQTYGGSIWRDMNHVFSGVLEHMHDTKLDSDSLPALASKSVLVVMGCTAPVVVATAGAGLAIGALQNRFNLSSDLMSPKWSRLNPVAGFGKILSTRSIFTAGLNILKLGIIGLFSWSKIESILNDPIFHSAVDTARIATFLATTCASLATQMLMCLTVLAACDYGYQVWKMSKDLMMTKFEVKEESKQTESNPLMKGEMRKRRSRMKSFRAQLEDVSKADVVLTNPTHLAIALWYDKESMGAPKIVAKARGFNAVRIREEAKANQIPIIENKPLARMLFKYGRVDGEVPFQLYSAIAEIMAYVYRINRFRYHSQGRPVTARR